METTTKTNKPHALMWIAGTAVTLFSALGIAAIMGWMPTSFGHQEEQVVAKVEPHKLAATRAHVDAERTPRTHVASATEPKPVGIYTPPVKVCAECGVIESVQAIDTKGQGSGLGAVGGAVVGGVAGNQIGHGTGKTVATVVGVVGGGFAGNEIEKYVKSGKSYDITVRMEDGSSRVFHEAAAPAWQPGNRVKIVNGVLQANS